MAKHITKDEKVTGYAARVTDLLVNIQNDKIDESIQFILNNIKRINNNNIDDCKVYCNKTGKHITSISITDFKYLVSMHGFDKAKEILQITSLQYTDPLWLFTDGERLDYLKAFDPIGYCIYAASRVYNTQYITENIIRKDSKFEKKFKLARHEFIVQLRKQLDSQAIDKSELNKLNELMSRYLQLIHTGKAKSFIQFSEVDPNKLTIEIMETDIIANIKSIIKYYQKTGLIKPNMTAADVIHIKSKLKGYSNFRTQQSVKGITDTDIYFQELGEAFIDFSIPGIKTTMITVGYADQSEWHQEQKKKAEQQAIKSQLHTTGQPLVLNFVQKD